MGHAQVARHLIEELLFDLFLIYLNKSLRIVKLDVAAADDLLLVLFVELVVVTTSLLVPRAGLMINCLLILPLNGELVHGVFAGTACGLGKLAAVIDRQMIIAATLHEKRALLG